MSKHITPSRLASLVCDEYGYLRIVGTEDILKSDYVIAKDKSRSLLTLFRDAAASRNVIARTHGLEFVLPDPGDTYDPFDPYDDPTNHQHIYDVERALMQFLLTTMSALTLYELFDPSTLPAHFQEELTFQILCGEAQ